MKKLTDKHINNNKINLNKPGLLLVHANWCGHCTRYFPKYKQLAKLFPEDGDFLITHIESEELNKKNVKQCLGEFVQGFPTLLFFDKNGNIKQRHDGDRENLPELLKKICKMYNQCKKF